MKVLEGCLEMRWFFDDNGELSSGTGGKGIGMLDDDGWRRVRSMEKLRHL